MTEPRATPLVRKLAAQHGVTLAQIQGTGAGGRITADDVYATAGVARGSIKRAPSTSRPVAAAAINRARPRLEITTQSTWVRSTASGTGRMIERPTVRVDVYADNPLVDELRQVDPQVVAEATRRAQPPTLFATGHLPLFTASGLDVGHLLQLPWVARHAAARASQSAANELFELCGEATEASWARAQMRFAADQGVVSYLQRVRAWAEQAH